MTTTTTTPRPRLAVVAGPLVEAGLLVVGLPVLLVRAVGLPLPHTSPKWADIQRAYQLRYVPHRFVIGALADTEQPQGRASLIKAALSLVRTPPFDASRPGAFHWASDLCFDSRMRIKINEATRPYEENTDESDTTWAPVIRLAVIMGA